MSLPESLRTELERIVGADGVLTDPIQLLAYDCDAYTIEKALPTAVVLPQTTEQVAAVARLATREGLPIVPRGAGTGLSGGALATQGGIVLAFSRMTRILWVDTRNRRLRAQAGAVNYQLTKAVQGAGLHFAPDPSSQGACTIGGNVAENSGGPHTLKYGVTVNHITGLQVVLPDGEVAELGGDEDEPYGYDLVGLLTGSEGTLAIVTEVTARLTPNPQATRTLLAVFETLEDASQTVSDIIAAGIVPAALELMDALTLQAVEAAFGYGFPLDAEAVLLIELDGLEAELDGEQARALEICQRNRAREVRRATTPQERAKLWAARKKSHRRTRQARALLRDPRRRHPALQTAPSAARGGTHRRKVRAAPGECVPRGRRQPAPRAAIRRLRPRPGRPRGAGRRRDFGAVPA
jgi:glycolate oxidase